MTETLAPSNGVTRAAHALQDADLSRRVGRVNDLIGLIIEATGVQVEIGEVCMVGEGRERGGREPVPTEVVGFRGGRTLLMPLGELHGIGPGTSVHPTGSPFRVAVGDPLLGRVIDGLGNPLDGFDPPQGVSWRATTGPPPDPLTRPESATGSASGCARSTRSSHAGAASASASSPARASASPR